MMQIKKIPLLSDMNLSLSGNYFVTGTDTEIGKTTVTCQLVQKLVAQGQLCYAIKPITAGINHKQQGQLLSDDALRINQFSNIYPPNSAISPILLRCPCSPHIAAKLDDVEVTCEGVVSSIQQTLQQYPADSVLIEGAGGWFTPINQQETFADIVIKLNMPVIVVVGIKLGCLNHAILTLNAIWQSGLNIAMVVMNQLSYKTDFLFEQIDWLQHKINQQSFNFQESSPIIIRTSFQK